MWLWCVTELEDHCYVFKMYSFERDLRDSFLFSHVNYPEYARDQPGSFLMRLVQLELTILRLSHFLNRDNLKFKDKNPEKRIFHLGIFCYTLCLINERKVHFEVYVHYRKLSYWGSFILSMFIYFSFYSFNKVTNKKSDIDHPNKFNFRCNIIILKQEILFS